ncbi:MAG: hypothetical protein JWM62_1465 [Frankiales bacterium]|nr:hypothetical protein [Frankiales bacterium]
MPRVLNVALAALLLLLVAPVLTEFGGKPWYVQVFFVGFGVPVLLLVLACLASAARPGSLGRAVRRRRRKPADPGSTDMSPERH